MKRTTTLTAILSLLAIAAVSVAPAVLPVLPTLGDSAIAASTGPTGLVATPRSSTQIGLAWTASIPPPTTGYVIQMSSDGGVTFVDKGRVTPGTTTYVAATYLPPPPTTPSPMLPNTPYSFRVAGEDGAVRSDYSNVAGATTLPLPAAPTGICATPRSSTQFGLEWTDVATDETGYEILYRESGSGNPFVSKAHALANAGSAVLTTYPGRLLEPGKMYDVQIKTERRFVDGSTTDYSEPVTTAVTLPALPTAPVNLTAVAQSPTKVLLTWQNANSGAIVMYRKLGEFFQEKAIVGTGVQSLVVSNYPGRPITGGNTYEFQVVAKRQLGPGFPVDLSPPSNTASTSTPL